MQNNRPTKEITVSGHRVVIKTYATGREYNEIQSVYLRSAKISMVGKDAQVGSFTGEVQIEAVKKSIEMLVVSVDDITQNVVDVILDFPLEDYETVVTEINEITSKKKTG